MYVQRKQTIFRDRRVSAKNGKKMACVALLFWNRVEYRAEMISSKFFFVWWLVLLLFSYCFGIYR